jgi:excisionase family DNA binding protein
MRNYSISEAARELRVQRATLYEWIKTRKVPTPTSQMISGVRFRFWTEDELEKVRKYKAEHYWEKPSRKRRRRVKN